MFEFFKSFTKPEPSLVALIAPPKDSCQHPCDLLIPVEDKDELKRALLIMRFARRKALPIKAWEVRLSPKSLCSVFPEFGSLGVSQDVTIWVPSAEMARFQGLARRYRLDCKIRTVDSTPSESAPQSAV